MSSAAIDPAMSPPMPGTAAFEKMFPPVAAVVLGGLFLVNLYAALEWRSLFADGINFLLNVLGLNGFFFIEPARRTVHVLQELPTIVALRMGVSSVGALAFIYGLTLQMLPLALTAACYPVLPRGDKPLFIFPLADYLLGSMPAAFAPIVGGPVAAGYFWLLLFLLLFGRRQGTMAATVILAAAAISLHETMIVLLPILCIAAAMRAQLEPSAATRKLFVALAVWFAAITVVPAWFIINPTVPAQRDDVLRTASLLFGIGDPHHVNTPAAMAVAAGGAILAVVWWPRRLSQFSWLPVLFLGVLCVTLDILTIIEGENSRLFHPVMQFVARNLAVIDSAPLAILLLLAWRRPAWRVRWMRPPVAALVLLLALGQIGWQAIGIAFWDRFVVKFETILNANVGFVPWTKAIAAMPQQQRREFERLSWGWTNGQLSVVLAPEGRVSTIIGVRYLNSWQPFDPERPDQLPAAPQFNYDRYLQALGTTAR